MHLFYGFLPPQSKCRVSFVGQYIIEKSHDVGAGRSINQILKFKLQGRVLENIVVISSGKHVRVVFTP